jgi:2,4-dienoyl-CoA reductase-like NADH-dependent reductase (Old Yellow Enzyme family)/alpha-beta hydrolase superfamily lysophospholipase
MSPARSRQSCRAEASLYNPSRISTLFSRVSIGPVRLANRLVRAATLECVCPQPEIMDARYLRLYENLARGGAGLIVTGYFFVHRLGIVQRNNLLVDSDGVIPELSRLTAIVRRHGVPLFGQINHGGRYARPALSGAQPLAPSAVRDPIGRLVPRVMSEEDIETAIEAFVSAARRLRDAGFDGLEINACHGYLVNQFLSGFTNRRHDRWGGCAANRFRFLAEVVRRTRAAAGSAFPLTVKLNGNDFMRGGITVEECLYFARELQALGASGLAVSGGFEEKAFATMSKGEIPRQLVLADRKGLEHALGRVFLAVMKRGAHFTEGYFLPYAAAVKGHVSVPVTAVGGFRSLAVMEAALLDGSADLIGLSRPLVREPHLARRLQEGRSTGAACVSCNRCTVMSALRSEPLRCHWRKEAEGEEDRSFDGIRAERLAASDGFVLFYRFAMPERPRGAVLFLRGMSEHSGTYLHVVRALADAGFVAVAPDQRDRGRSVDGTWRRGDLHSVNRGLQDLDELREQHRSELEGLPLFILGVGMGSIIARMYALRRQASLAGVLLVGPPFGVPEGISRVVLLISSLLAVAAPRLAVRPAPPIERISRVRAFQNELHGDPWCNHGPLRARPGRQLASSLVELQKRTGELALPLMILYGTEDRIVSRREVEEIHRRWGGTDRTFKKMEGLYHDVLNEPERQTALEAVVGWLAAQV